MLSFIEWLLYSYNRSTKPSNSTLNWICKKEKLELFFSLEAVKGEDEKFVLSATPQKFFFFSLEKWINERSKAEFKEMHASKRTNFTSNLPKENEIICFLRTKNVFFKTSIQAFVNKIEVLMKWLGIIFLQGVNEHRNNRYWSDAISITNITETSAMLPKKRKRVFGCGTNKRHNISRTKKKKKKRNWTIECRFSDGLFNND